MFNWNLCRFFSSNNRNLHSSAAISTDEPRKYFACINRQAIRTKFAAFQTKVYEKLINKNVVDVKMFRLFVINQFPPGNCFPPSLTNLLEIFEAITRHGLWDCLLYFPLIQIINKFAANDTEMEGWVQSYEEDLKAYSIVTTVEDHIETDLSFVDPHPADALPAKRAKYNPHYYTAVEWKTKFIDHTSYYLAEVWRVFSCCYIVPDSPPSSLLDHVCKGCFAVIWLVPSHLIPDLIKRIQIDNTFFQKCHILRVTVGSECVYEDVTVESTSVSPLQLPSPLQIPIVYCLHIIFIESCMGNFSSITILFT